MNALYQSTETGTPVTLQPFGPEEPPSKRQAQDYPPVQEPELVAVEKPHS